MKRLIVRACGNSSLEDIRASIEARLPYAQFHESLESFRMLTFEIPDENIDQVKNDVHGCGHKCSWDQTVSLLHLLIDSFLTRIVLPFCEDWPASSKCRIVPTPFFLLSREC